jgi:N-acetyl-S-(2-succino)cysteine monooxygenase
MARPPQGHPVLAQAGSSEVGREFAAEIGELIFTPLLTLEAAKAFYRDLKGRAAKYGRDPDHIKIMPGLNPIVGRTDEEAKEKPQFLQSLIHPNVGRTLLSAELGIDLLPFPVDGTLPYHLIAENTNAGQGTLRHVLDVARRENLTIRELYCATPVRADSARSRARRS